MSTSQKNKQKLVDADVCDMFHSMSTADNEDGISICANCGKEGSDVTNKCNKCKSVKYCNAACKKKHRHKHKKECERRVAELNDEQLFKQPPPNEDCPICMIPLPPLSRARTYMMCCGKIVCRGCIYAVQSRAFKAGREEEDGICPFCRAPPPPTSQEMIKMYNKRIELNDANAIYSFGSFYVLGQFGLPQSYAKALKLWHQAGELGNSSAYSTIALSYEYGRGVEMDMKQAVHFYELAAKGGHANARHDLGVYEEREGNPHRAMKHYMIGVKGGNHGSLKAIKTLYMDGCAKKDDFETALRYYQAYLDEIKSDQRDEAAAARDVYKYYESAL